MGRWRNKKKNINVFLVKKISFFFLLLSLFLPVSLSFSLLFTGISLTPARWSLGPNGGATTPETLNQN
jgi:hypothetical protein